MSEAAREILPETTPVPEILPESKEKLPMRWHGFLVKFYLWTAAAYHLFQAGWILSGRIYIESAARDAIYAAMPGMRILDYGFAALLAIGAVLLLASRAKLARKNKTGIALLTGAYILLAIDMIAYLPVRLLVSGMPPLNLPLIGQAIACLALLGINRSYYRKRL